MRCHICGSSMTPIVTDFPFKVYESTIAILKNLPVLQCEGCTEYLLDDSVMQRVDGILVLPTLDERIMPTMVETWLEQGIQAGEKRMLLRLLERRFGKVPKTYQTRIAAADADTLLLWGERVLSAQRLADVFSEPPPSEPAG